MAFAKTAALVSGLERRELGKACAAVGLPAWAAEKMAERVAAGARPTVVWLPLRECDGCAEPLLGAAAVAARFVDLLVVEGCDPSAGMDAALAAVVARGGFVLAVEGARRRPEGALEMPIAEPGTAVRARGLAEAAAAVVAVGSCVPPPAAAARLVLDRPGVVALPGCPVDPCRLLGTVLQLATFGTLPALDAEGRPRLAYGHVVHEDCPRRPYFDAGRFARSYGDAAHRAGLCLYELGCAGARTAARCALLPVCEAPGGWPLATGHPCVGCADQGIALAPPSLDAAPRPGAPLDGFAGEELSGIARVRARQDGPSARGRRAG